MQKPSAAGFTLIELAIVMVIFGLMLTGMLIPLQTQTEHRKLQQTREDLMEIKEALIGFAMMRGRLPCPSYAIDPADPDFGVEHAACATVSAARDGYLPWKTLGVAEKDAWGRTQASASDGMSGYWRYRVDRNFVGTAEKLITLNTDFSTDALEIKNSAGLSLTTSAEKPVAIIYSTGRNLTADANNANYEIHHGIYQSDVPSTHFDDILLWISRPILMNRMVLAGKLAS